MGCFNVACTVSNISINAGDPCYILPLLPNSHDSTHEIGALSSLIYSNCYFDPFCFPIQGVYNDYGGLKDIVPTENTKAIEDYFGITIQEFADHLTEYSVKTAEGNHKDILNKLSSMFIHGEIYEMTTQFDRSWYNNADVNTSTLELLGFTKTNESTGDKRYNKMYIHPDVKGLKLHSDGTWTHIPDHETPYHSNSLLKFIKNEYNINIDPSNKFKDYSQYKFKVENALKDQQEILAEVEKFNEMSRKREKPTQAQLMANLRNSFMHNDRTLKLSDGVSSWDSKVLYNSIIEKDALILSSFYIDFKHFSHFMYSTNNFYFPAMNGEQHGNPQATLMLTNKTKEIMETLIKKYEEEY